MGMKKKLKCPEKYESLIKFRVGINNQKGVEGVYDTGTNSSFISQKIIDQMKADLTEHKSICKTISGNDFTSSPAKLKMKINKIEEEIDVFVVRNCNSSHTILP